MNQIIVIEYVKSFIRKQPLRIEPIHVTFVIMFSVQYKTTQRYYPILSLRISKRKEIFLINTVKS